ncbi:MAG: sigma factor [Planctomycetota bacterium]
MDDATSEFVNLWNRYQPEVRRYVGMLVPRAADADDVIQQTATRLWAKFEEYDAERPFVAWAIGFAYHEVLSWRQRQARDRLVFSEEILSQLHATITEESSLLELRVGPEPDL